MVALALPKTGYGPQLSIPPELHAELQKLIEDPKALEQALEDEQSPKAPANEAARRSAYNGFRQDEQRMQAHLLGQKGSTLDKLLELGPDSWSQLGLSPDEQEILALLARARQSRGSSAPRASAFRGGASQLAPRPAGSPPAPRATPTSQPAPAKPEAKAPPKAEPAKTETKAPPKAEPAKSEPGKPEGTSSSRVPFQPNAKAVESAEKSNLAGIVDRGMKENGPIYKEAERVTGVPAHLVAAIHYNEGGMGKGVGPESGYGLDPKYVSQGQGDAILKKYGVAGPWERGTGSERSRQQSAIIAADRLKFAGEAAGAKVGPGMTEKDYAIAIHAYGTGSGSKSTKNAQETGRGFMFDPSDDNPHPMHPGGTSAAADGSRIQVPPGRKEALLRWDVLIPMIDKRMEGAPPDDRQSDTRMA